MSVGQLSWRRSLPEWYMPCIPYISWALNVCSTTSMELEFDRVVLCLSWQNVPIFLVAVSSRPCGWERKILMVGPYIWIILSQFYTPYLFSNLFYIIDTPPKKKLLAFLTWYFKNWGGTSLQTCVFLNLFHLYQISL